MSGDSGRPSKQVYGLSVRPEPVVQKSFQENVADIINEVVFTNQSHYEGKEKVVWVKFDQCDLNDLTQYKEKIECNGNVPPFLLMIGYTNGVQVWVVQATGLAVEVLSLRQGPVRTVKILVTPTTSNKVLDKYSLKRPIIAICDAASPGAQFHSVAFLSLLTGESQPLKTIKFKSQVQDIHANKQVIVISFAEKLAVFEATTFDDLFTISTCYKSPGTCVNPIALGDQWLAFADRKLHNTHQSCGGVTSDSSLSYKSSVINVAKSLTRGLKDLGESVATNLMGTRPVPQQHSSQTAPSPGMTPGVVTIIDTQRVETNELNLANGPNSAIISHFVAHQGVPIVSMEFDPSGTLLATADKLAHNFHVFKIQSHPASSSTSSIQHLYSLYRGDTTAKVLTMTFSLDSRWLAVATHRGTTHIYPIAPYGGSVSMRTHKSLYVVNKLTCFQRSAGLDDHPSSGRNSPVLSASPGSMKTLFESSPNIAYHNPFYPPYSVATVVKAVGRIRQPDMSSILDSYGAGQSPSHSPPSNKSSKMIVPDSIMKVALNFGSSRGWIAGSPTVVKECQRQPVDSLFVMGYHGYLIEYTLRIKPLPTIAYERIRDDETQLELDIEAYAQWPLLRESTNQELRPPLHRENPLIIPLRSEAPPDSMLDPIHDLTTHPEEKWMSQVEILTYTGPSRRLWMGPQFSFKTINGTGKLSPLEICAFREGQRRDEDQSLDFPLAVRSSPMNIRSKDTVHIDAKSHSNSVESDYGEFEKSRGKNKIKDDIADAMNDVYLDSGNVDKDTGEEYSLDMSDVMDITCDPVGPSCDYPNIPVTTCFPAEDQLQAVTTKLRQVAVTSQPQECISPHWGSRTPSLGELKASTSSGEDVDHRNPMLISDLPPLGDWDAPSLKNSWDPLVIDNKPNLTPVSYPDCIYPMIGSISKSGTTSEDDLWASKESKKDRKRRRKKVPNKDLDAAAAETPPPPSMTFDTEMKPFSLGTEFDVDLDHFHTAEEFPEVDNEDDEPPIIEASLEQDDEPLMMMMNFNPSKDEVIMMESIHNDPDDLQKALEEASSDESGQPVLTSKKGSNTVEMFPFRETSSDEDESGVLRVRRRGGVLPHGRFDEEEDERETSGDDRKTTSESDVTTSPNPRGSNGSKNKKKKKKKK